MSREKSELDILVINVLLLQDMLAQEFNEVQKMPNDKDMMLKDESTWNKISKHFK